MRQYGPSDGVGWLKAISDDPASVNSQTVWVGSRRSVMRQCGPSDGVGWLKAISDDPANVNRQTVWVGSRRSVMTQPVWAVRRCGLAQGDQ